MCVSQLYVSSHHVYVHEICQNVDHLSSEQSTPPAVQRARRPPFFVDEFRSEKTWPGGHAIPMISIYGYGSMPINTIFRGMNIHKSQLF